MTKSIDLKGVLDRYEIAGHGTHEIETGQMYQDIYTLAQAVQLIIQQPHLKYLCTKVPENPDAAS